MKAEAVRLPVVRDDDPDSTHTVQIRQGGQLFPLDYECTESEAKWLADRFQDALAAHDAETQTRTDKLVAAVEGVNVLSPAFTLNDHSMLCLFCGAESAKDHAVPYLRRIVQHYDDCWWIVLQSALAAYKQAKEKVSE